MKKEIRIELSETELVNIIAEHFKTPKESSKITINHLEETQREPAYTSVIFTAPYQP